MSTSWKNCSWIAEVALTAVMLLVVGSAHAAQAEETGPSAAIAKTEPGQAIPADAPEIDFSRDIQPILARRCFSCHGPDTAEGGLRLHEHEAALAELDSGEHAIVPGDVDASALLLRIKSSEESERMPPEGKPLTSSEIDLIEQWIAGGAKWQEYWAFQPPEAQEPPAVSNAEWVRNPIDAFILKKLEDAGLQPAPQAEKLTLLRRVYYDLTGLPPTPEEVQVYLNDQSPDAYEKLIDRLLASPRYGERWARHWLDLVRYADTNSFERDGVKPNAWKYRDYVIRAFNDDKPYDQFILEQLAGDELPAVTDDSIIATGYYRLGLWDDEPADRQQARYDELDDIIGTTSQVFLGLTIHCARCHDHKIDPIPQTDYYKMLAIFHEVTSYGGNSQTDLSPPDLKAKYAQLDAQKAELEAKMREIEQRGIVKLSAEDQRKTEGPERPQVLREKLESNLSAEDWQAYGQLRSELRKVNAIQLPPRELALSVRCAEPPPETVVFQRGNPHVPGNKVEPGFPELFGESEFRPAVLTSDKRTSGRRLALAQWIASPENMMTSRVMVNRLWQHHFGRGIVRSSNNFGQLGEQPTHPELLDWLAAEFVRSGWKMKPMHKLIMMSNSYQMASIAQPDALAKDPQNNLFWRFDMRRLSAEEIRDSIHAVTGVLNLQMFGPGFYPELSAEIMATQSKPGDGWGNSSPEEQARRSIYIHVKRSLITPILADFDLAETDTSCAVRFATTQPAQALGMLNGEFIHKQAEQFAERLKREAPADPTARVSTALRLALHREPDAQSVERGVRFLQDWQTKYNMDETTALKYYCLVVLNLNEFVYLD